MKSIRTFCLLVLASGMALGQANQPSNSNTNDDLKSLKDAIAAQQKQIAAQQQQLETLQKKLDEKLSATPRVENATLTTTNTAASNVAIVQSDTEKPKSSPLSFRIGGTEFKPGGFVDFTNIFRTTNTGSAVSTGFNAIPFSNTPQGQLTEFRSSAQYSRFSMDISGKYGENNVNGYIEADFNGNDAANVFLTTNPHTLRLRLFYLRVSRGIWEVAAGQGYGLETPNKVGVSLVPSTLDTTLSTDGNIAVGVPFGRISQFRVIAKPSDHFAWALSVDNPQQFTGAVTLPKGFAIANQVDGAATAGVPNLFPDILTKFAYDTNPSGKNIHVELGGVLTSAQLAVPQPGAPATGPFTKNSVLGGGVMGGFNASLTRKFRVLAYGMYGDGIGRYFNGFGAQFAVVPIAVSPTTFTAVPSMIHSGGGYGGFEWQVGAKNQIGAYYGGQYTGRNAFPDVTAAGTPIIGYGGIGSANSNNRAIQEGWLVIGHTLWKDPQYGAVVVYSDSNYTTRAPWFVAAGSPKNAHMFQQRIDLKYVLP
ncbi:MAG TPA: hypothetical protein VFY05_05125 [Candidatus Angelobacter sp.]|nr:hypothetical protein [Candidatus Angelobacter sp.]